MKKPPRLDGPLSHQQKQLRAYFHHVELYLELTEPGHVTLRFWSKRGPSFTFVDQMDIDRYVATHWPAGVYVELVPLSPAMLDAKRLQEAVSDE